MNNKKISIITVVKNGMPYLKDSIKSFNLQNYQNKELIIVYSPSNDKTEEFLNKQDQKNIIIKKDEHSKTMYGSIINGINFSSGDIFGLLHSDDIFYGHNTLDTISKQFETNIDCIYGNIMFCDKKNIKSINRIWISGKFHLNKLKYGWTPPHTSIFLRKEYFEKNKKIYSDDYKIAGDYFFVLNLFKDQGLVSKYINAFTTIMRTGGGSTNLKNFSKKFKEDIKISKIFFKNNLTCIFFKILRKSKQLKFFKKKINNNYLNQIILDKE